MRFSGKSVGLVAFSSVAMLLCVSFGMNVLAADQMGSLKVNTNPSVPTIISVDDVPRDERAISKVPLSAGQHEVSFSDVPGFATPEPVMVNITAGKTSNIVVQFAQLGALNVTSAPGLQTTIFVDGLACDDWGLWAWFAPGIHTVSFGPVPGYDTPADQTVRLRAGEVASVQGVFVENESATAGASGVGMLRVASSPSVATTIIVDGQARDAYGLQWMKIEAGVHVISFTDVPGFATPEQQTVVVVEGGFTNVDAQFQRLGVLRAITSAPNSAVVYIDGVARDSWGIWLALPQGTYTVEFGAVRGHETPPAQTVIVIPGQIGIVIGQY